MDAFGKLQEKMEPQRANREAEREEHWCQMAELLKAKEADKEELKQEILSMMQAPQGQAVSQQVLVMQNPNLPK
jgi:Trp operon repressor